MANIIYTGKTYSSFSGFSDNAIFKMSNGSYWVQTKYKYWYHYAYRPEVVISEENGQTILTVAGHSIPVKRVYDVIESQIDGEFNGWDGNTRYKLTSVCFQGKIHCNNRASSQKCGIIDAREMTRNREKPCIWRPKCTSES